MQAALSRLYVDGAFLDVFCMDSHQALRHYFLTEKEAKALAQIDHEAIRKFAQSLRVKTWKRFEYAYRLLYSVNRPRIFKYYLRFYEIRKMRPNESFYGATVELGEFLEDSILGDAELPSYVCDLARYERLFYLARYQPRPASIPEVSAIANPERDKPEIAEALSPESFPVLRDGVEVALFDWDMSAIEKALDEGTVPPAGEKGRHYVVFHRLEKLGRAKKFHV